MASNNQGGKSGSNQQSGQQGSNQSGNQGGNQGGGRGGQSSQSGDTSNRGFASMDPDKQREIASEGGRAAHASGNAHEFTSEEARKAGSMSHKNDGNQQSGSGGSQRFRWLGWLGRFGQLGRRFGRLGRLGRTFLGQLGRRLRLALTPSARRRGAWFF